MPARIATAISNPAITIPRYIMRLPRLFGPHIIYLLALDKTKFLTNYSDARKCVRFLPTKIVLHVGNKTRRRRLRCDIAYLSTIFCHLYRSAWPCASEARLRARTKNKKVHCYVLGFALLAGNVTPQPEAASLGGALYALDADHRNPSRYAMPLNDENHAGRRPAFLDDLFH